MVQSSSSLKLCMVGFDNAHHVAAVKKALHDLNKECSFGVELKIWISSEYTSAEAMSAFRETIVLGSKYYWHGNYNDLPLDGTMEPYSGEFSDEKLAHLSYAFCRTTVLLGVQKAAAKHSDYFKLVLQGAIDLLVQQKIDLVVHSNIPHAFGDLLICYAAEIIGIRSVYPEWIGFNDLLLLRSLDGKNFTRARSKISEEELAEHCLTYLNDRDLRINKESPSYLSILDKKSKRIDDLDLQGRPRFLRLRFTENIRKKCSFLPFILIKIFEKLFILAKVLLVASVYRLLVKMFFASSFYDLSGKYVLVFLQTQPEMSTSPVSFDTPLEFDRVCQLAKKYPNITFLLREHPYNMTMHCDYLQFRKLSDFLKISRLNNVIYTVPSTRDGLADLIASSEFVLSTSSTASIEAVVLGTPALVFSDHVSAFLPGVIKGFDTKNIDLKEIGRCRSLISGMSKEVLANAWAKKLVSFNPCQAHISGYFSGVYSKDERIKLASELLYDIINDFKYNNELKGLSNETRI